MIKVLGLALMISLGLTGLQSWRLEKERSAHLKTKSDYALAFTQAQELAAQESVRMQREKDEAIAKAQEIARRNAVALSNASRERDRLRNELSASRAALANSTSASVIDYADTLSVVFDQCVREYLDMAEKADGHALDAQKLYDGWKGLAQ